MKNALEKGQNKNNNKLKKFGQVMISFAQKVSQNKFVSSIMEGFILVMPIIIASTIFILLAELAPSFGLKYSEGDGYFAYHAFCMRLYNLSYGLLGFALCTTISARMADKINSTLKPEKKMNLFIIGTASMIAYVLISLGYSADGSFKEVVYEIFGVKGIFIAMITGLTVPWIFWLCYRFNLTIRLPKQVPQNISHSFLNIFPMLFTIIIYGVIGFLFSYFLKESMLNTIFGWLTPLIEGAKNNYFFVGWSFVLALTWFCGIHTSVWSGVTDSLGALGLQENIDAIKNGMQAKNMWPNPMAMGAYSMGGTGAQIAVPLLIILFCKSKQLKSIGLVALVPVMFQVNEPILFGVPSILNPLMAVPFLITPLINGTIGVIFVELLGMNSSYISMPWSMPIFLAMPISVGFQWQAFIVPFVWFGVSFGMYFPFIILQDNVYYKKEISVQNDEFVDYRSGVRWLGDYLFHKQKHKEIIEKILAQKAVLNAKGSQPISSENITNKFKNLNDYSNKQIEILVVCIGAGTSAMLAESINSTFKDDKLKINAKACSSGNYSEFINDTDLVIISPQARAIEKDLINISKTSNLKVYQTKGAEFLKMINDKDFAKIQVIEKLTSGGEKKND
ncbi:PTS system, lactose-specific IIB component [Spiroplasma litorale]|uniref:PTS system lactose-specific EIICB component n=1 Tax=Spiroplasma litorale TaxID=216942 RepID=A0A0K1W2B9_9MOLU|nr:PTS transporter subunit EIIC [Spiroplasma litorale]AKX34316.1 PTS system, lactose-specific IIB component [Spiroplasma litorale]